MAAAALALAMLAITTAVHYEALEFLARAVDGRRLSRRPVIGLLTALVGLHLVEVALYAVGYLVGAKVLGLGVLQGARATACQMVIRSTPFSLLISVSPSCSRSAKDRSAVCGTRFSACAPA